MMQILIGVLVVVVIILGIIFFYQKRCTSLVKGLSDRLATIDIQKLDKELNKNRLETLMGESLKKFTALRQEFDEELVPTVKKARALSKSIQAGLHNSQLFSTSSQLKDLQELVGQAEKSNQHVRQELDSLNDEASRQMAAISKLREQYNKFGRTLDEKSFQYGNTNDKLQRRLVKLEKDYEHFSDVARKGDHDAAADMLKDIQQRTDDLANLMKEIPELYRPLYAEFPEQLKELRQGYQDLHAQGYHFTEEDLDDQVDQMEKTRQKALKELEALDLAPVKSANHDLAERIDHLYDVMQQELDAKPHVMDAAPKIKEHLQHAIKQNESLLDELEHLSLSYTLNNNELVNARGLAEQLKQIQEDNDDANQALKDQTAVYSVIFQQQEDTEKHLREIETQQKQINDGVSSLRDDEKRTRQALQRFVTEIRTTKRRVESLNLPGIPQDYLDYFFVVSDEISKLSKEMNKQQINMEDITKQLLIVQEDLESLQEKTDNLRDSAALTERLIQYANRLSGNNGKIDEAINNAQALFNKHEYTHSLETIGAALEEAEPGSFKRIENDYYSENK